MRRCRRRHRQSATGGHGPKACSERLISSSRALRAAQLTAPALRAKEYQRPHLPLVHWALARCCSESPRQFHPRFQVAGNTRQRRAFGPGRRTRTAYPRPPATPLGGRPESFDGKIPHDEIRMRTRYSSRSTSFSFLVSFFWPGACAQPRARRPPRCSRPGPDSPTSTVVLVRAGFANPANTCCSVSAADTPSHHARKRCAAGRQTRFLAPEVRSASPTRKTRQTRGNRLTGTSER